MLFIPKKKKDLLSLLLSPNYYLANICLFAEVKGERTVVTCNKRRARRLLFARPLAITFVFACLFTLLETFNAFKNYLSIFLCCMEAYGRNLLRNSVDLIRL